MSLNIGGEPVRKIYWGADEVQEVRQGLNLVFVPSAVVFTGGHSFRADTEASEAYGSMSVAGSSTAPDPIDTAIYKRLKVRVSISPSATFYASRAEAIMTLVLQTSDASVVKTFDLDQVAFEAGTVGEVESLLRFPYDFRPGADGLVVIKAVNYQYKFYDVTGSAQANMSIEFEAIC